LTGKNSHTIPAAKPDLTSLAGGAIASLVFILLSIGMISYAGVQEDEALFSIPFYTLLPREYRVRALHHNIPLMVMSYVGALKTWIYWPLIHWFGPGVWTLRLPVAFAGAITISLFYHLIRNAGLPRPAFAALIGALLLATDPVFLLTNTFDWGPVALEHVLLVTGCYLLLRFGKDRSKTGHLAFGFLCFGLALWNKALFVWALSGLTVAAIATCWSELKACLTPRYVSIAAGCFLFGALPFLIFNARAHEATVSENAHLDFENLSSKWLQLGRAADGSSLFGFMVSEDAEGPQKAPPSWRGRLAGWIWRHLGEHRATGFFTVLGVILATGPLWWRSRAARFSLVFMTVAWSMMALTRNAGGAAHHDVLLWPFPILFAVSALARLPWRWLAITAGAALIAMNLLVINQYVLQFERDGAAANFTDALFALDRLLPEDRPIYVIDWGMTVTSQLSHQGRLHVHFADGASSEDPDPGTQDRLRAMLSESDALWVDHVPDREVFRGAGSNIEKLARAAGYRRELLETVRDSNGRPVFEIFRYRRA
jgi:4-amino-4-deoxy-L-arabinose transferase-like glycosyltransferase